MILKESKPKPLVNENMNFMEAVEALGLPRPDFNTKNKGPKKSEISLTSLLEKIDLSGFVNKRISRAGLNELITGMEQIPCIRTLILRNNGIGDEHAEEILRIFNNRKIKSIDLSQNNMEKLGAYIGRKLRDETCSHITWIDLTQNQFYDDSTANSLIIAGLKKIQSTI
eukprot:CAMPEP_0116880312 /NCGR_PEP_ID=MMETSP0463-20121206/12218_1 /TAXON_ID=181622 /ORGANISM="Strombidinopsis sp, Strain SopsisLIS2011" /LENGTH=168 /DNA_ID=CAMNT_0004530719 /DNA_START=167 /DNA_END=674 /DNA_ORIENTATION=-